MKLIKLKTKKNIKGRRMRILKFVGIHLTAFAAGLLYIFVIGCPVVRVTGISCPGCGLSRACLSALRLNFAEAFRWYPLFFIVVPFLFLWIHEKVFLRRIPQKWKNMALYIVCIAIFTVYIARMILRDPLLRWDVSDSLIGSLWRLLM